MVTTQLEKPLNPRQQAFVTNYLANGGNASQAAKQAGYAPPFDKSGPRLLKHEGICREIERRQTVIAVGSEYSLTQWRQDLLADIEAARQSGSHSAVMKGRELLGRHIGALNDHRQLDPAEARWFDAFERAMVTAYGSLPGVSQPASPPAIESSYSVSEE